MAIIAPKTSKFVESEGAARLYKPAPSPLILTHSSTCFRYSCLGDLFLLTLLLYAIPIASIARTAIARVGLWNLCSLKVLHGIAGNQVFGERLDATARSLNDYFVYIPA